MKKRILGFTLIELLVVISIIAILITLGFTSFSSAQKKARDAKRKSDIRDIKNALEQYYSLCGFQYPLPNGNTFDPIVCSLPDGSNLDMLISLPLDPKSGNAYYCPEPPGDYCTDTFYQICADMEAETSPYCVINAQ